MKRRNKKDISKIDMTNSTGGGGGVGAKHNSPREKFHQVCACYIGVYIKKHRNVAQASVSRGSRNSVQSSE